MCFFFNTVGSVLHVLPSSHLNNLRIDIIASKGDIVVSYDEKTLIMWDMKTGAQKASFTADKVRKSNLLSTAELPQAPTLVFKRFGDWKQQVRLFFHKILNGKTRTHCGATCPCAITPRDA